MGTPRSKNDKEEREYWDQTSLADHLDESQEVELQVSPNLSHILSVRIQREDFHRLAELALKEGVGPTTMARMLLKRALSGEGGRTRTPLDERDPELVSRVVAEVLKQMAEGS